VTGTIAVGSGPDGVAVDAAAHTVYVANFGGAVSVINETTGTVTRPSQSALIRPGWRWTPPLTPPT